MQLIRNYDYSPTVDTIERVELTKYSSEATDQLNTYRNWHSFGLQCEPIIGDGGKDEFWCKRKDNDQYLGTKAIFNNSNAILRSGSLRIAMNAPLLDAQAVRDAIRQRGGCSIKDLVDASKKGLMGRAIYNYSDFMYCKYLGKVSNNYLVTLRRFPYPCGDHINSTTWIDEIGGVKTPSSENSNGDDAIENKHAPDIGRLVTWLGTPGNDLNEILKYSVKMPYEEMTSEVQSINGHAEDGGTLGNILNLANGEYREGVLGGYAGSGGIGLASTILGGVGKGIGAIGKDNKVAGRMSGALSGVAGFIKAPSDGQWKYHVDKSKPYGPVDVIAKTHIRKGADKGGLEFEQDISLCFDYELRSYDGINGKAAMLDLLGNILSVTYTNGKFWGGEIRNNTMAQSSVFTNLPIFNMKEPLSLNKIRDTSLESLNQVGKAFGIKSLSIEDIANGFKNFASSMGTMLLGGALNALGRPQKEALNSLLTSAPVGLWHLTIGNPKHPIMSIGNMILDGCEIQHYGPLGLDDFPTGLKVTVKLKHGMPRDKLRIEQMYGMGDNRIYIPMGKDVALMYEGAETMHDRADIIGRLEEPDDDIIYDENGFIMASEGPSSYPEEVTQYARDHIDEIIKKTKAVDSVSLDNQKKNKSALLVEYFGTDDQKFVKVAAEEAHLGSSPAKTQEEADKDLEKAKNNSTNKS